MTKWDNMHPGETDDRAMDFAPELAAGETLTAATWALGGLTKVAESRDGAVVRVRITGGQDGRTYALTCTATTSNGRTLVATHPLFFSTQ